MRIGADIQLPRQGVAFQNNRVADPLGSLAVGQLAVQPDSLLLRKILLLKLELRGQVEQSQFFLFLRDHFIKKCQVIAKEQNGRRIIDLRILADIMLEENRGHGRNVLVAEAQIGTRKASVTRLYRGHSYCALLVEHVPRKNLLGKSHRQCGGGAPARGLYGRKKNLPLQTRNIEWKKPAVFDHLPRNLILARGEFAQRDLFPAPDAINQREVCRSQQPQVLAILRVNALDIFGDHHADAGAHLGIRGLLTARSLAAPFTAHRAHEPAALYIAAADGCDASALQAEIRDLTECLVEIKTVVSGSDLVGRNVVAQLGIVRGILRVPRQVFARQLPLDQLRVFGEKQNASLQTDFVGPLFDLAFQK